MNEMDPDLPIATTLEVRDRCLCLHAQRAARALARRFDAALKPVGLNNGQFSLMMALNRPEPPRIADLAPFLAMDRTTLTAALKVLERRGLVEGLPDRSDRRARRLRLTVAGRAAMKHAVPIWRSVHNEVDAALGDIDLDGLKAALVRLGAGG
ncbi:MarR family winged helix-turn-helix transcriptional regulator [Sagittula salina]|uniref:Winged helix-turn-helix transcriptional regulator n=1 Tax=Sagittula salina TaxID=2820268 RepID=A0A940MMH7_9RHOB|nr:winged helix-turn-helix transcriptional regulator [Sagittula salina]